MVFFCTLEERGERLIAGKEFTGRDKKVTKMTRDSLTEENLRDRTVKDISHKSRGRPEDYPLTMKEIRW